jgi:hypothetical protein
LDAVIKYGLAKAIEFNPDGQMWSRALSIYLFQPDKAIILTSGKSVSKVNITSRIAETLYRSILLWLGVCVSRYSYPGG